MRISDWSSDVCSSDLWSNIAREIWLDAKLNPNVPAFSAVLACSTSMTAAFAAAGMLGGGVDLTMVGGAEVMSRPPIALTSEASKRLTDLFGEAPAAALAALRALEPQDYVLPRSEEHTSELQSLMRL